MKIPFTLTALAVTSFSVYGATTIFNLTDPLGTVPQQGNYRGFNVTFNDTDLSVSGPGLATENLLTTLTVRDQGAGGFVGNVSMMIYALSDTVSPFDAGDPGSALTFVGRSTTTYNFGAAGTTADAVFSFNNLALTAGQNYFIAFTDSASDVIPADGSVATYFRDARLSASNVAGDVYSSGGLWTISGDNMTTASAGFDTAFVASFVPEPSVALLGGLGVLGLLRRRRA